MQHLPKPVQEYLSSTDALYRAEVAQRYPNLQELLASPATRAGLLKWLSAEGAWAEDKVDFVINAIDFLRPGAAEPETAIVRSFVLHTNPVVRCRVYEFMLTLYYPDKNREAMLMLFQNMLADDHDMVRSLAARYISGLALEKDLHSLLERWLKSATARGWQGTDSVEFIEKLLGQ